jgi:hypothetical protein
MFGVVPRVLWEKKCASTPDNLFFWQTLPCWCKRAMATCSSIRGLATS